MTTRAFILIEAEVGRSNQVAGSMRLLEGVKSVDVVTGTFDVIALIEAADMHAVAELVTGRMQAVSGVMRTITCVAAG